MKVRGWSLILPLLLAGCGRYRDFTLPTQPGGAAQAIVDWKAEPLPVLMRGAPGEWDSGDVLNPSVIREGSGYLNLYSGFDGKTWRTGVATSPDGLLWRKTGPVLSPANDRQYIAANGSVVRFRNSLLYYFQEGRPPRIRLAARVSQTEWRDQGVEALGLGPWGSWDERGAADPYVIEAGGTLYMYYLGMDRARRQRLGLATSTDGRAWTKLRSNPVLELGEYGAFDGYALGEPAVWASHGSYWMLYTGTALNQQRRLGLARSTDGVHWRKLPKVIGGGQPWDSQVICDPSVIVEGDRVRVWFGGGDVASPDENLHGQIGYGVLTIR